jgi:hypothetical protein
VCLGKSVVTSIKWHYQANKDGQPLQAERNILESLDGFMKPLDEQTLSTSFSMKVQTYRNALTSIGSRNFRR